MDSETLARLVEGHKEIIENQEKVLYNQRWTVGLEWGIISILMIILAWKVAVYPRLLALIKANETIIVILSDVFSSLKYKQDTTIEKQNQTLEKVEEVKEKVTAVTESNTNLGWKSGDPDRRKGN